MYDYVNLELPAAVTLPASRSLVWRGGNGGNAWDVATTANWRDTNNVSLTFADGDNVTFTAVSGASVEALVIYIDTGNTATSRLVAYIDTGVTGLPVTPNGGDISITWNASGIFQL